MIKSWTYVLRKMSQHTGTPMKPNMHVVLHFLLSPHKYRTFINFCQCMKELEHTAGTATWTGAHQLPSGHFRFGVPDLRCSVQLALLAAPGIQCSCTHAGCCYSNRGAKCLARKH
jgi:hypothetical protein